ncbi:MAG: hypothetical protein K0Q95_260 [Bacteroidota bacterium]|jgi:hypothetical protein|nr:hypothetical protein [Bacteroidota bacterium]
MSSLNWLKNLSDNFFLRKHQPSDVTVQLLKDLYPGVDWSRVDFYEGLPYFTPLVAPYVTAQALPDFYSLGRYRIYLKKFDETRAQCIADIVHEGMHVMQAMQYMKGYGFGFLRGFLVRYIALFFKHGYRNNPFEIPAYEQEFNFLSYCHKFHQHGILPGIDPFIVQVIGKEPSLVFYKSEISQPAGFIPLFASFLLCLLIALLKPLADLLVFIFWLLIRSVSGFR